uniref:RAS p21 protein activator 3 n=1 Tax=Eptatretus burgeri TaxID=7764 RepID=A0A8C4NBC2_EPTBU
MNFACRNGNFNPRCTHLPLTGEAKNLQPHPSTHRLRDCFCTVNLDQEEVFRTQVVEKCLCPFFGEDYYCEIPRSFRFLSFYLYDRVLRRDTVIGKVAIDREKLSMYNGKDTWFAVQQVDDNSEVQGKVHLDITVKEVISDGGNIIHQLLVRVLECQGLPIVNDRCDPYAVVTLTGPTRNEQKKTKVKKETTNPFFNEVFYFEVSEWVLMTRPVYFYLLTLTLGFQCRNCCGLTNCKLLYLLSIFDILKRFIFNLQNNMWVMLRRSGKDLAADMLQKCCFSFYYCPHFIPNLLPFPQISCQKNLKQYVTQVFRAVMDSAKHCPTVMSDIFFSLRQSAIKHFPDDQDVKYTAVSSFIFLRFFAPAILSPNLFHLRDHCPDQQTSRTLKLISKTIQAFGSLLKSRSVSLGPQLFTVFIEICSQCTGFLISIRRVTKRAQGRRKLSLRNFKERWLRLTNLHLSYHRTKDSPPLCIIPLEDILAVEGVEEESFKKKNMFQVIQPQRTLYVQASNCVEAKSWMDVLARVSQSNTRLEFYHPAAYISGTWLCCKAMSESADGCKRCTGRPATNIELDIDSDRETQRIYSLFINNVDLLEKMQEACGSRAVYDGPTTEQEYAVFNIEEPYHMFLSLRDVAATVRELEQHHERIRSTRFQKTKYGSVYVPAIHSYFIWRFMVSLLLFLFVVLQIFPFFMSSKIILLHIVIAEIVVTVEP